MKRTVVNVSIASALAVVLVTAATAAIAAGKPGGTTTRLLPISLGTSANCNDSYGIAINDGIYPNVEVAGQAGGCPDGQPHPVLWSQSTQMIDIGVPSPATGGSAEGVSTGGTVSGWALQPDVTRLAFVRTPSGDLLTLSALPGMSYASAHVISPSGQYIVGDSSTDTAGSGVLWVRSGDAWNATDLGGASAVSVNDSGTIVGHATNPQTNAVGPYVQTLGGPKVFLPVTDTKAHHVTDISPSGNVIVGYRDKPTTKDPNVVYPVPVVWRNGSGAWTVADLTALDNVDSEAHGVGERAGKAIIVGHGYTRKDAITRAVAWLPDSSGNYGAPIRLEALDGQTKSHAWAEDVNSSGQVVGSSTTNAGWRHTVAVVWKLP